MIFRAMVDTPRSGWHNSNSVCVVFVEASTRDQAASSLRQTLASLWHVEAASIDWTNLHSEFEMMADPCTADAVGDHKLFVTGGYGGKPDYANGDGVSGSPVFLLTRELNRMMNAYLTLPRAGV
jgi:hypothetical protein